MYLLNAKAIVPVEQYVAVREAHTEWVKEGFARGWFLFAGPKKGETGGFIAVHSMDKNELEDFINQDPFIIKKVASYEISEISVFLATPELAVLKDK